ncbi:hypothetical protein [Adhaeribacter terreus]|uniref:Uncharacterized protein n=1 Tax=Adhaeribacter terreus TaxID=529703 RepID=A0ABW0EFT4_9BACT
MKIARFIALLALLSVSGSLPAFAQTGKIGRELNGWGFYTYRQNGQKISGKALLEQFQINPTAYHYMRKAQREKTWANIFAGTGFALAGYQLIYKHKNNELSQEILFTSLGAFGAALSLTLHSNMQAGLAIDYYNQRVAKRSFKNKPEFEIGFAGSGIGLQMKF